MFSENNTENITQDPKWQCTQSRPPDSKMVAHSLPVSSSYYTSMAQSQRLINSDLAILFLHNNNKASTFCLDTPSRVRGRFVLTLLTSSQKLVSRDLSGPGVTLCRRLVYISSLAAVAHTPVLPWLYFTPLTQSSLSLDAVAAVTRSKEKQALLVNGSVTTQGNIQHWIMEHT